MKILFTGASSFTGFWMASALCDAGHEVTAIYTKGQPADYADLRRRRVDLLGAKVQPVFGLAFGEEKFLEVIRTRGPFEVICHHGSATGDYKSPAYDYRQALERDTRGISAVLDTALAVGLRAFVHTGTYFEADEGTGSMPHRAFSPYALSKTLSWQTVRFQCEVRGIRVGKFVLPNPVGLWDEPRLVGYLLRSWARRETAIIQTPGYVRDNAPVELLAKTYAGFVQALVTGTSLQLKANPSGWAEPVADFATRLQGKIRGFSGLECAVDFARQTDFPEPLARANTESVLANWPAQAEQEFWQSLWAQYRDA